MRPEVRRSFQPGPAASTAATAADPLPRELAFLRRYGIPDAPLRTAQREASELGVSPAEALIAGGAVSQALYYRSLAHHLRLPFVGGFAGVDATGDASQDPWQAMRDGAVRLRQSGVAGDAWLLAPTGPRLDALLVATGDPVLTLPNAAITTPAHLSALVRRSARELVAWQASFALAERYPASCAKRTVDDLRTGKGAILVLAALAAAIGLAPRQALLATSLSFLAATACRLLLCANASRARVPASAIRDGELPVYSVIVPLHDEAAMVPGLIANLDALDYPRAKLEIKIVIEAGDQSTRLALESRTLNAAYEIIVAPEGEPRTKPRALNVVLPSLRGELVTIFDAEDEPEPDQLRKAAARFAAAEPTLACLQGRLAMTVTATRLSRLFAIEYAVLFDLFNVGTAAAGLPVALGGTSNHFRLSVLRDVGGWDAWNVAEDADLGFRLARSGYAVEMLESTTREQAPLTLASWMKQRRRWTKGWMQTALVLGRHPGRLTRELGLYRTGVLALTMVSLVGGPLLLPVMLVAVPVDVALHGWPSPRDACGLVTVTIWVSTLAIGMAAPIWCGYAGIKARGLESCLPSLPSVLPYQALIAAAAWLGLFDLIRTPYHWHKTEHRPLAGEPEF